MDNVAFEQERIENRLNKILWAIKILIFIDMIILVFKIIHQKFEWNDELLKQN